MFRWLFLTCFVVCDLILVHIFFVQDVSEKTGEEKLAVQESIPVSNQDYISEKVEIVAEVPSDDKTEQNNLALFTQQNTAQREPQTTKDIALTDVRMTSIGSLEKFSLFAN